MFLLIYNLFYSVFLFIRAVTIRFLADHFARIVPTLFFDEFFDVPVVFSSSNKEKKTIEKLNEREGQIKLCRYIYDSDKIKFRLFSFFYIIPKSNKKY